MDQNEPLRIAGRIHYGLLRRLGTGIEVETMLSHEDYAREVLYVCQGIDDPELQSLARAYTRAARRVARPMPVVPAPVATTRPVPALDPRRPVAELPIADALPAPQDIAWAQDTSGFGVTGHLDDLATPAAAAPRGLLRLSNWFKRDSRR